MTQIARNSSATSFQLTNVENQLAQIKAKESSEG